MTIQPRALDHIVLTVRDLEAAGKRFEALGFTVTPKAQHSWGTANRLVQFQGRCFIEILTVDRPELLEAHSRSLPPGAFDFGAFNRDYLARREGFSMLVLSGQDSQADRADFAPIGGHPTFDFERKATLPDGSAAKVAFSLAFASDPALPDCGFFTCHNRFPDVFWKPAFQSHANGATDMARVVMAAPDPAQHAAFFTRFTGQRAEPVEGGLRFPLVRQELLVVEPARVAALFPGQKVKHEGSHFVGIHVAGASALDEAINGMLVSGAH
ncbi:MAG: VOC family protein [Kiloniellales bacterium]